LNCENGYDIITIDFSIGELTTRGKAKFPRSIPFLTKGGKSEDVGLIGAAKAVSDAGSVSQRKREITRFYPVEAA
jgi:hypothetical protein